MIWLGMCALGVFIGYVIGFGIYKIQDWSNPYNVFTAIISSSVAGGAFTFIESIGGRSLDTAVFIYPVGLVYGVLCVNMWWVREPNVDTLVKWACILAFGIATVLLVAVLLCPPFRSWLPA